MTLDVDTAQNEIANPTHDHGPIEEKTTPSRLNAVDSWGPVPTKKASVANLAPYLAGVAKKEHGADVFLLRTSFTW